MKTRLLGTFVIQDVGFPHNLIGGPAPVVKNISRRSNILNSYDFSHDLMTIICRDILLFRRLFCPRSDRWTRTRRQELCKTNSTLRQNNDCSCLCHAKLHLWISFISKVVFPTIWSVDPHPSSRTFQIHTHLTIRPDQCPKCQFYVVVMNGVQMKDGELYGPWNSHRGDARIFLVFFRNTL